MSCINTVSHPRFDLIPQMRNCPNELTKQFKKSKRMGSVSLPAGPNFIETPQELPQEQLPRQYKKNSTNSLYKKFKKACPFSTEQLVYIKVKLNFYYWSECLYSNPVNYLQHGIRKGIVSLGACAIGSVLIVGVCTGRIIQVFTILTPFNHIETCQYRFGIRKEIPRTTFL